MSPASRIYLERGFLLAGGAYLALAAAFCNRQRFLVAAMMFRNPSALIRRFFLGTVAWAGPGFDSPRSFAHRAFCAIAILRRAAALILLRLRGMGSEAAGASGEKPLSSVRSSAISPSICSLRCSNPSMAALAISSVSCFGMSVEISFDHGDTNFSDPRARLVALLAAGALGAGMLARAEKSRIHTHKHLSIGQWPGHPRRALPRSGCQTTTRAHPPPVASIHL